MAEEKQAVLTEIGVTGLRRSSGVIYEEFLRELQGDRWQRVIKQMVTDPVIGAVLFAVEMVIRRVDWSIQPGGDSSEDVAAAEFVEECHQDMSSSWPDTLAEILSFLPWGWSFFECVYKRRDGSTEDGTSKYTDGRIGWRKFAVRSQDTLSHWEFDDKGGVRGMWQHDPYSGKPVVLIPIEKALLFRTTSRKNSPEGVSIFRSSYQPWYFRQNIARIEAIGIERDLAGYPVFKIPGSVIVAAGPVYEDWKTVAVNMRRDEQEALIIPSDVDAETKTPLYDVKLLSTGGSRQFDTNAIVARYDQRIMASCLADFLLLGTKTGSYALSSDKTDLFETALNTWCETIAGVINSHAIPRLLRLNGIKTDNPPQLKAAPLEHVDLGILGKYINDLAGAGLPLFPTADGKLESELIEKGGLSAPAPEAFVEQATLQAAADEQARQDMQAQLKQKQNPEDVSQ